MTTPIKAIVTGHSRGLGAAIAERCLARGIPVLGLARRGNPELLARYPDRLSEAAIDMADAAALAAWIDGSDLRAFCADAGTLLLINNAGTLGPVGPIETQAAAAIATAVQINVAAPLMLAGAAARDHAGELRVVHISSGAARSPYAGWSVYCATKAALDHHARAVAADQNPALRICSLAPGVVDTDMQTEIRETPEAHFPLLKRFRQLKQNGLLTAPDEAARRIVDYSLGADFGKTPTADLRELP
ncbi:SDR family oxidoreductase [Propionivibrio dicarboxylicus]|uniref:Short-chain dehydrogenase n=1 Tax=Propionivibrio dicarboxylicus TaxID=83767 RepID=A0A1G8MHE4_9RHOO|nr:SDR family oxidoreductase [Propionivibrio dicarboxylicus]SDI67371.1 hypothetical protein SAMN05660652_03843 [Propionivibrio dicarboxylicus]